MKTMGARAWAILGLAGLWAASAAGAQDAAVGLQHASHVYTCTARSPNGSWGYWHSYSLATSKRRALHECAVHTPANYVCRIKVCF